MKTIKLDRTKLISALQHCAGYVRYRLGAKPGITVPPGRFTHSDCSGFVRWLIHYASAGDILIPDGSWYQNEWCKTAGFKLTDYNLHAGLKDERVRIAFIAPKKGRIGHVWLIHNGMTLESCGGTGVCRRPWDTHVLKTYVSNCYVLTDPLEE